jgi:hypothetical protein
VPAVAPQHVEAASLEEQDAAPVGVTAPVSESSGASGAPLAVVPPAIVVPPTAPIDSATAPSEKEPSPNQPIVAAMPPADDEAPSDEEAPPPDPVDHDAAPAVAPPVQAHVTGTLDVIHMRHGTTVYRGAVTFAVGDQSTSGWLGCAVEPDERDETDGPDDTGPALRCWFASDDDRVHLVVDGRRSPPPPSDGRQLERYDGAWYSDAPDSEEHPAGGTAVAGFEVGADKAMTDLWLDLPAGEQPPSGP